VRIIKKGQIYTSTIPEAYPMAKRSPLGERAIADMDDMSLACVLRKELMTLNTGRSSLSNNSGTLEMTAIVVCRKEWVGFSFDQFHSIIPCTNHVLLMIG